MNVPKDPPTPSRKAADLSSGEPISLDITTTNISNASASPTDSAADDEDEVFGVFGARAVDQAELERGIATKADQVMLEGANEDDRRRLDKAVIEKAKLEHILGVAEERYGLPQTTKLKKRSLEIQIKDLKGKLAGFNDDIKDITSRMAAREAQTIELLSQQKSKSDSDHRLPNESDREFLIRTGKITPFDNTPGLGQASASQEEVAGEPSQALLSVQNLRKPGFEAATRHSNIAPLSSSELSGVDSSGQEEYSEEEDGEEEDDGAGRGTKRRKAIVDDDYDDHTPARKERKTSRKGLAQQAAVRNAESESSEEGDSNDECDAAMPQKRKRSSETASRKAKPVRLDDGDEKLYQKRIREWSESRRRIREQNNGTDPDERKEWHKPHPTISDESFSGGVKKFRLPGDIHASLFPYQKVAVQWFWELYCQERGGILGDEMGTGKTIQMISFLAGLHYSGLLDKPIVVVAPGAVLGQWASEFHTWWPALRVAILHKSGSGMLLSRDGQIDSQDDEPHRPTKNGMFAAKKIVERVFRHGHVLITTYEGLNTYGDLLVEKEWGYAILDEGHRIRNPDSRVSLHCKELRTPHRIILSGTPIQNNLVELWSLFDFAFPGRLGTLPIFKEQFEVPIRLGGYKNASNVQVQTATSCATVLRGLIGPYLLRRMKSDVSKDLPPKEEKVLFCKLTTAQENMYTEYLRGPEVQAILSGNRESFSGISVLRKICCHPDLATNEQNKHQDQEYGKDIYSGKMQVMKKMLVHWKKHGHRVLLFSQSVQVLDIIQHNLDCYGDFKYSRMDGRTPIEQRQQLVSKFNADNSIDIFLLTTRVGGLGLNLTGADRVMIFDPDWNPSTDLQARERSWRIGQTKPVHIFRLVSAGTIEEKMYNRQLFKQYISQKVLNNPEQRRFFEMEDMRHLFTYGDVDDTSTGAMFRGAVTVNSKSTSAEDSALRNIDGVIGLQKYAIEDKPAEESGERKFIEEIFSHNSVANCLEHDSAVNTGNNGSTSTIAYARKIAEEAAKRLQESIAATSGAAVGTVTWTGRNGSAGRVPPRSPGPGSLQSLGKQTLRTQMLNLFQENAGKLPTGELKKWCRNVGIDNRAPEKAKEMRAVLKNIAQLDKETHMWSLRK